jgi:hypothetical protein
MNKSRSADRHAVPVTAWSRGAASVTDPLLRERAAPAGAALPLEPEGRFYAGRLRVPAAGTLVLDLRCPRPLRLWLDGRLVLDEPLFWRHFLREVRAAVLAPRNAAGEAEFLVEVGPRPIHPTHIDRDCPSRNRERVITSLPRVYPDALELRGRVTPGQCAPAASLRFWPTQFRRDGVIWQHVGVRPTRGAATRPSTDLWSAADEPDLVLALTSSAAPGAAADGTSEREARAGLRRFLVPVADSANPPRPRRRSGPESRLEPVTEVAGSVDLTVEGPDGRATLAMPVFESLGRLAPLQEFKALVWPKPGEARDRLPEPVLPDSMARYRRTYDAAWDMLFRLVRHPDPAGGLPCSYIATGSGFPHHQFVWDTSFTALCTRYGYRVMDPFASLNVLYSRQFDGGYLHREHDVRDGLPALYEPDFSPNPPIMSVAEWAIASVTGDVRRLRQVYPALKANHEWLVHNRRLPDGTYWTTGLANGLDNSPSLGEGYPDLTAQMAHEAEMLGRIARQLGLAKDAAAFAAEHRAIGRALNQRLWSESLGIYTTSLPGGGHNPNKVVTAFWPLWAGIVPPERVELLAAHLKDPRSFWRHHPLPSLAADSPHYQPAGNYWLGSTWAPTNFAAIKGFDRAGRHDLAVEAAVRHLECVTDVLESTGRIWENYCAEASKPGNWACADYCWSALGPVALLLEVILGFEPDALAGALRWRPPEDQVAGIRRLPLGAATVSVVQHPGAGGPAYEVDTDRAFTLDVRRGDERKRWNCRPGRQRLEWAVP